jgi:hypothetical protein
VVEQQREMRKLVKPILKGLGRTRAPRPAAAPSVAAGSAATGAAR